MLKDILTPKVFKAELSSLNLSGIARKYGVSKQYIHQLHNEYRSLYPDMFREPEIEPDWLKEQLELHTVIEICNMTGKSYHHIRNLMRQYNLTKNTVTAAFDKEYIREQYVTLYRSDKSLAEHYGCSASLIRQFRYKHSILKSDRLPLSERLPLEEANRLIQVEGLSPSEISEKYDATSNEVIKLLNRYAIKF